MVPVVIFGASRGVGLELARRLRAAGKPVCAMLRPGTSPGELADLGVRILRGDAMHAADPGRAMPEDEPFDIVSTIGGRAADGRRADEAGNVNIIDSAAGRQVRRFVLVTSIGCGDMAPYRSERAIAAFGEAVDAKTRAEEHLRRQIPRATILRPGGLRSGVPTGRGILSDDPQIHGMIQRADVADLILRALADPATEGRTFAAVDAGEARSVNPIEPFPLAG